MLVLVNVVQVESLLVGVFGDIGGPAIGVYVRVLVCGISSGQSCLVEEWNSICSFCNYNSAHKLAVGGRFGDLIARIEFKSEC